MKKVRNSKGLRPKVASSADPAGPTPKRGVGGSNPLWDARKHRCKPFFGVCSVFLFLLLPVICFCYREIFMRRMMYIC